MWEKWDGTNSRNHPMFGGGITWLYQELAGMKPDPNQPGYRHIIFRPQPAGDLTSASYSNLTPYGEASVSWEKNGRSFTMDITVPVGSTATVYVPASSGAVDDGDRELIISENVRFTGTDGDYDVLKVNSGKYRFISE
jgi:alpha-L-rhamnosidase